MCCVNFSKFVEAKLNIANVAKYMYVKQGGNLMTSTFNSFSIFHNTRVCSYTSIFRMYIHMYMISLLSLEVEVGLGHKK